MSSASRGLAPCEGLELGLMKTGHTGPPLEPRRRLQEGKSGDPRSQNPDTILCTSKKKTIELCIYLWCRFTHFAP